MLCLAVWGRKFFPSLRSRDKHKMAETFVFMKNYYLFIAFAMVENLSTDVVDSLLVEPHETLALDDADSAIFSNYKNCI